MSITRNFQQIQLVRRLIHDGRYDEARQILMEMQSPKVPQLHQQLNQRMLAGHTTQQTRIFTRIGVLLGIVIGVLFTILNLGTGTTNIPFIIICFVIGFVFGLILPEHDRRREVTREYVLKMITRRHSRFR